MKGINLDLLPSDLVAVLVSFPISVESQRAYFPLDHVSPDGRTAYFIQQVTTDYTTSSVLNHFGTPILPPRNVWNDYKYEPDTTRNLADFRAEVSFTPAELDPQ